MKQFTVIQNLCASVAPANTTVVVKGAAIIALTCKGDRKPMHANI